MRRCGANCTTASLANTAPTTEERIHTRQHGGRAGTATGYGPDTPVAGIGSGWGALLVSRDRFARHNPKVPTQPPETPARDEKEEPSRLRWSVLLCARSGSVSRRRSMTAGLVQRQCAL
jgi:hypothetical protein